MAVEIATAAGPSDLLARLKWFVTGDGELRAFGQAWALLKESASAFTVRSYWGQTCSCDVEFKLEGRRLTAIVNGHRDLSYWAELPDGQAPYLFASNGRYITMLAGDNPRPAITVGLYRQFRHPADHKQPFVCGGSSRGELPAVSSFVEPDHSLAIVTRKGRVVSPTNDIREKFLRDNPATGIDNPVTVLPDLISLLGETEDPIGVLDGVYHINYADFTTIYDIRADEVNAYAERIRVLPPMAPWQIEKLPAVGPYPPLPKNESNHIGDIVSITGRKLRVEQVLDRPASRWAVNLDKREPDVTCIGPFEAPYIEDCNTRLHSILPLFG